MKRFKIKNEGLRRLIIICLLILILYIYFDLINNTTFYKYMIDNINSKYSFNYNIGNRLLYNTLNKIVDEDTLKPKETTKVVKVVEHKEEVKKEEIIKETKKSKPIIYIYNTHDTEAYSLLYSSDYSIRPNVKLAAYILKDYLNDYKIESVVQKKQTKDYLYKYKLNYNYSYKASREYMLPLLKQNDFKILIDLHRDSVKHKYTLYKNGNKKYAKVMFVLATDYKTYKKNEKFVNDLNNRLNKKYKGITRGIMKRSDASFNQDLSPRAILIELGGVDNTLEEINNTLHVLAEVLSEYIKEEL